MSQPTPEEFNRCALFDGLAPEVLEVLAGHFDVKHHEPGRRVVNEGDSGYAFYVVIEGTLTVSRAGQPVRRLGPGDFFGEIAIDRDGRRSATVVADGPTVLWVMFGTRYRSLQMSHPEIAENIRLTMESRLFSDTGSP